MADPDPTPIPTPPIPADVARHDQMVALVQRMLGLHRELAAARSTYDKVAIGRRIAATDGLIDGLVYELYALTDAERRIVEEGGSEHGDRHANQLRSRSGCSEHRVP